VRYVLVMVALCALLIGGIGYFVHEKQFSDAKLSAKDLRPYKARVEEIQHYNCKGSCYRLIVSYAVNGKRQLSKYGGSPMPVGHTLIVWAKPNFEYAYTSPQAYVSGLAPSWSPASFLLIPLLALLGAAASSKLNAWRNS
jgi:hypothetical protein